MIKKPTNVSKTRNSSIEILRIVAIFIITACHLITHGNINIENFNPCLQYFWFLFLSFGGKIGVNIFILITGYYLITSKMSHTKIIAKLLFLWGELVFYMIAISIFSWMMGWSSIDIKSLFCCVLPISKGWWWFASTYFILYLLHPYINKFLNNLSQLQHLMFIVITIILWSMISYLVFSKLELNNLVWFIVVYSLGAYFQEYNLSKKIKRKKIILALMFVLIIMIIFCSFSFSDLCSLKIFKYYAYQIIFLDNNIFSITCATLIFLIAISLKPFSNKIVNLIAGSCFAVYLITDSVPLREHLWTAILNVSSLYDYNIFLCILFTLLTIIVLFVFCVIIDIVRKFTIEKAWIKIVNLIVNKSKKLALKIIDKKCWN